MPLLLSETEVSIALLCHVFSTCYTPVRIKNCLKSTYAIKVATRKDTDNLHYAKEAIMCNHHFTVSKDEWNTKEDSGKSLKNTLEYCGMPKGTSLG